MAEDIDDVRRGIDGLLVEGPVVGGGVGRTFGDVLNISLVAEASVTKSQYDEVMQTQEDEATSRAKKSDDGERRRPTWSGDRTQTWARVRAQGQARAQSHRDGRSRGRSRWEWKTRRRVREELDLLGELPCRRVGICFHHLQRFPGPWAIRSPPLPDIGQGRRADGGTDGQRWQGTAFPMAMMDKKRFHELRGAKSRDGGETGVGDLE